MLAGPHTLIPTLVATHERVHQSQTSDRQTDNRRKPAHTMATHPLICVNKSYEPFKLLS